MKKLIIVLLIVTGLFSCSNNNSFKIKLNLEDTKHYCVYLSKLVDGRSVLLDSVVLKDNAATFKLSKNDNVDAYQISMKQWRKKLPCSLKTKTLLLKVIAPTLKLSWSMPLLYSLI